MMKKLLLTVFAAITFYFSDAQLTTPQPSPTASVKQNFGLSNIELSYSRPGIKGRKVFGDLVPFGKVWRTGANNATTITFGDDVTVGGQKIAAGKYGLLTIPDSKSWTIIITKQTDVTSAAAYKQSEDVARITAVPVKLEPKVESFTMDFSNISSTKCSLDLSWENTMVSIPIETEIDSKIMAQINKVMNDTSSNKPYYNAAVYYLDNNKDLNTALAWFKKAEEANPKAYWVLHQKANCLVKLGKKEDAIAAANQSIVLAKEAKNDDYVTLNEKLLAKLK